MTDRSDRRVVIVTGGSSGIGLELVKRFHLSGDRIIVLDKHKKENSEFHFNNDIEFIQIDLLKTGDFRTVITNIVDKFTNIDILINCAGIYPTKPALNITSAEWNEVINLNLNVPFLLSQAVAIEMIKRKTKGSIINVASTAGKIARPGASAYCSSKAGLIMMTKVLAMEWAEFGIRVNSVCPGVVATTTLLNTLTYPNNLKEHEEKLNKIPLKRAGEPSEIAESVLFLADNSAAGFITGQALYIDGGYSAGQYFSTFKNPAV